MDKAKHFDLYLDFYDDENLETVWCWKKTLNNKELASQEFRSEQQAIDAMNNDQLIWSSYPY